MKYSLAIEFGSVNTCIYRKGEGLVLKEPSLICVEQTGDVYNAVAFGINAKKMQGKTDDKTYIFSPISEGKIQSKEYAVLLLQYFLKKVIKNKFLRENTIICVSSMLSDDEKKDFVTVLSQCKLGRISLVPSVVCSALMTGQDISSSHTVFMVNVGGTTTEIATINRNSIVKGATLCLGGRNIDVDIANMVAEKYEIIISMASAQKLKEEIASLYENDTQSYEVIGFDESTGKPKRAIITCDDVRDVLVKFANYIAICIETSVNMCPPEILSDIFSNGIFLSGGTTNISGIDKYLRKFLNIDVKIVEENELATILGAGKLLSNCLDLDEIIDNF